MSKHRVYHLTKLGEISLFQDVWMQQILRTVLYYITTILTQF